MPDKSFERFYYEKVALNEGCGCAEHAIRTYDIEAHSRNTASRRLPGNPDVVRKGWLARLFRRPGPQSSQKS